MRPLILLMSSALAAASAQTDSRVRLPTAGGRLQEWGPTIRVSDAHGGVTVGRLRRVQRDTIEFRSPAGFTIRLPYSAVQRLELRHRERGRAFFKGALIGGMISVTLLGAGIAYDKYGEDTYGGGTLGAIALAPVITLGGGTIGFLSARARWVVVRKP